MDFHEGKTSSPAEQTELDRKHAEAEGEGQVGKTIVSLERAQTDTRAANVHRDVSLVDLGQEGSIQDGL